MTVEALLAEFGAAWNGKDLDAALRCCTEDVVFESTTPPDGGRAAGRAAVAESWRPIFADSTSRFDVEDTIVADDRAVQLWRYSWPGGHVRGVDVFRFAGGKIAAKLSYVKG
jgi:ketosteroid isomerase-like protein